MLKEENKINLNKNGIEKYNEYSVEYNRYNMKKVAWICTAISVILGLIITKHPICLWALFIPALI